MAKTIRLTMAQALTKFMARQMTEIDGKKLPIFGGVWAIFGHGNVAGLGEALYQHRDDLPTYRAHNEQSMAHSAIAFAKANFRRRFMAATSSIGPGATNMVTAAALAHVNRLPVLLLPGDVFANRAPGTAIGGPFVTGPFGATSSVPVSSLTPSGSQVGLGSPLPAAQVPPGAPESLGTFAGISTENGGSPNVVDPTGAVGPGHYVQMVNTMFAVFAKSGARDAHRRHHQ